MFVNLILYEKSNAVVRKEIPKNQNTDRIISFVKKIFKFNKETNLILDPPAFYTPKRTRA